VLIGPPGSEEGLGIHGLRTVFTINKSSQKKKKGSNTCKLDIYNLSSASRSRIRSTEDVVIVRAGYAQDQGEEIIYRGDVTNVNHNKSAPDIITTIDSQDGVNALAGVKVSMSYKDGTSLKSIMDDLVKKFPFIKNARSVVDSATVKINKGFQHAGYGSTALDKIAEDLGLEWSIQDQTIKLVPKDGHDNARILHLSPSTGMIGSPVKSLDIVKKSKKKGRLTDTPGWSVKCLLQPFAEPGSIVSIESDEIKKGSQFKIVSLQHKGDNFGGDFTTDLDVVEA